MKRCLFFFVTIVPACLFSQLTLTLTPSEDAAIGYHDGASTAGNNYGNAPQLAAYAIPASAQTNGLNVNRGLLKFDLSSLPPSAIVQSAFLDLYAYGPIGSYAGHTGQNNSVLERVISNWSETTVTWLNQPQTTLNNQLLLPVSTNPNQNYLNLDVTLLVRDIQNSGFNYGLMLKLDVESTTRVLAFCSRDHGNTLLRPKLRINYSFPEALTEDRPIDRSMECYPNPAINQLTIRSANTIFPMEICIYDVIGRQVETKVIQASDLPNNSTDISLPLNSYKKGYYYIHLISKSGLYKSKFVIE